MPERATLADTISVADALQLWLLWEVQARPGALWFRVLARCCAQTSASAEDVLAAWRQLRRGGLIAVARAEARLTPRGRAVLEDDDG